VHDAYVLGGAAPSLLAHVGHVDPVVPDAHQHVAVGGRGDTGDHARQGGLARPAQPDEPEDLLFIDLEGHVVHGFDDPADDGIEVLLGALDAYDRLSDLDVHLLVPDELYVEGLGYFTWGALGLDHPVLQPDGPVRQQFDGLGPVGGDHHGHPGVLDRFDQGLVNGVRGLRVQGPGRFVGQEQQRLAGQLPGEHGPLLLPSGKVTGDVHGAVGHVDHLQQPYGPLHFLLVGLLPHGLEDVLDDAQVTVQSEGPLQHDGDPPAHGHAQGVPLLQSPEVDLDDLGAFPALGTFSAWRRHVDPAA